MQDVQDIVEPSVSRSKPHFKQSFKAVMLIVQNSCRTTWQKARGLPKRTQWITAAACGAVVVVALGWIVMADHHSKSAALATPVTLENGVVGTGAGASSLRLQLNDIQTQLTALQNQQQSGTDLNQQLASLQSMMQSLKNQMAPKHYLPSSVLPWAVVGVDVRNHQKVVVRADGNPPPIKSRLIEISRDD